MTQSINLWYAVVGCGEDCWHAQDKGRVSAFQPAPRGTRDGNTATS